MEDDGPEEGPPKWASLRHINGVTVYQEAGSGDQQGAYMVSAAVCATPREVFSVPTPSLSCRPIRSLAQTYRS